MTKEEIQKAADLYQEKVGKMNFEPFIVDLTMGSPIAFTNSLAFDGILAFCVAKDLLGEDFHLTQGLPAHELVEFSLPLEERGITKRYYACSVAQCEEKTEHLARYRKRWDERYDDVVDFGGKQERVWHKGGQFKSVNMPLVYVAIPCVRFFCFGNMAETKRLMEKHLVCIGKMASHGYGKIMRMDFSQVSIDISCIDCVKMLMRNIPIEELAGMGLVAEETQYVSYRAPYWSPANFAECGMAGSEVADATRSMFESL